MTTATAAKPTKYEVRDNSDMALLCKLLGKGEEKVMNIGTKLSFHNHLFDYPVTYQLTEEEIKGFDKRYWAFAREVEDNDQN